MEGLAVIGPKPQKRIGECFVCDEPADIGEGETGAAFDFMAALGVWRDTVCINPGHGGGHEAELEMIGDRIRRTGLAAGTADVLFDFLETGFNFPASPIVLDDCSTERVRSVEKKATHCVLRKTQTTRTGVRRFLSMKI